MALLLPPICKAQHNANSQLWADYILNVPFARSWLFENELTYKTLISGDDKWRSYNLNPQVERSITKQFDVISSALAAYTSQTNTDDSFEARIMLGTRLYFSPGKRIETRLTTRWENRHLKTIGDDTWQNSNRTRIRAEAIIPINKKTTHENKMWYAIADAEAFIVIDQTLSERFSNRYRFRLGAGYRLGYATRFEAIYNYQISRTEIGDTFDTIDHIIRLRVKHYLRPSVSRKERDNSN